MTHSLESHVSRFQSKVDEIRQDLAAGTQRYPGLGLDGRSALSGTPRSGSPNRLATGSPHRELPFSSSGPAGYASTLTRGAFTPGYSPAKNAVGATRFGSATRM